MQKRTPPPVSPPMQRTLKEAFEYYMPGEPPPAGIPWIWTGGTFASGYGRLRVNSRTYRAHRLSYELFNHKIPNGLIVRHTTDIKLDVNPRNLLLGTHAENSHDMVSRERQSRGEKHYCTKLTEKEVREIKIRHSLGESIPTIADDFSVNYATIWKIINNRSWVWVK